MVRARRPLILTLGATLLIVVLALGVVAVLAWAASRPTFACVREGPYAGQYLVSVTWTTPGQPSDTGMIHLHPGETGVVRDSHGDHLTVKAPKEACVPAPSPSPSATPYPSPSASPSMPPSPSASPVPLPTPVRRTPPPNPCQQPRPPDSARCNVGVGKG